MANASDMDSGTAMAIGAAIMGSQLGAMRDVSSVDDLHLTMLADLSIRAAFALHDAVPRARERIAAEERWLVTVAKLAEEEEAIHAASTHARTVGQI